MHRQCKRYGWWAAAMFAVMAGAAAAETAPLVTAQTRLAIVGDSITEQKQYSRFMELYLTACAPVPPEAVCQFGWGGDSAPGFSGRMDYDCLFFKPTLMTTCFGMNDGGYRPYEENIGNRYRDGMKKIIEQAKAAGTTILVGGPGAVDTTSFKRASATPEVYNANLGELSKIAKALADENGMPFADVHNACMDAMAKAKADLGENYLVMGGDGFHPNENGHFVMAYAFLKGMGLPGDIGTITIDLADMEKSVGTDSHAVTNKAAGVVEVVSQRWPFTFTGKAKEQSTLGIMPYVPFNQDLNRFQLVVKGLNADEATVQWGEVVKTFAKADLEKGVNLAEAFAGETPFQGAWAKLNGAVAQKQNYETWWIKNVRAQMRGILIRTKDNAEVVASINAIYAAIAPEYDGLKEAVTAAFVPVTHTITVKPVAR